MKAAIFMVCRMVPRMVLIASCALAGCGKSEAPAPAADAEPEGVLLDAAREPLERARAVEDISAERKSALDEQIDGAAE